LRNEDLVYWRDSFPVKFVYSAGIAGEKFFLGLKEGKILASKCDNCGRVLVPPRIFCEWCFKPIEEYEELEPRGIIESYAISYVNERGEKSDTPEIFAAIRIFGSDTTLIHKLIAKPEEVDIGLEVEAVFKPKEEREGKITDIEGFKLVEG